MSAIDTTIHDLGAVLRRSLALDDGSSVTVSLDAAGTSAAALLVRVPDPAGKEMVRTAMQHMAAAKRLIREATR